MTLFNKKMLYVTTSLFVSIFIQLTQPCYAEDSMLAKKPYFTYRIETKGALYETTMNGILLEKDFKAGQLSFEMPVNQYMRSGKNRVGFQLFTRQPEDFFDAQITVSLYVNQDGLPEENKKLISQITFNGSEFSKEKNAQQAIKTSMPALRLDSNNQFLKADNGDVIVHAAEIEPSNVRPNGFNIYQDIEVQTPFPLWGFFNADKIDFPDAWADYVSNSEYYFSKLVTPLYNEHESIVNTLRTQDYEKILPLFAERNREYDIALYLPEGTYNQRLKKSLESDFANKDSNLQLDDFKFAKPVISQKKELIRLGDSALISFSDEESSLYSNYPIWFYKKDGKWIISR